MHATVTAMNNGAKRLMAFEAETFDLVLMDGREATSRIRTRKRQIGTRIPIIALTTHALEGDRERCLAAEADWPRILDLV